MSYKIFIRPILFLFDPEKVHHLTFNLINFIFKIKIIRNLTKNFYSTEKQGSEKILFGLKFKNCVGLAAGFDKNALLYEEFGLFGFGHVEIGTVTPLPQPGNDKPRLFRLTRNEAIINRMGFNNDGADVIKKRLEKTKASGLIIGGNIGKNKVTSNEKAIDDYILCFEKLFDVVDYFVVNVSSPNTPGLRSLQDKEPLMQILSALMKLNKEKTKPKPLLLKIAPDLENSQLDDIIEIVRVTGINGVIATNTTISRSNLSYSEKEIEIFGPGGLSGKPLKNRSTEVIRYLSQKSEKSFPIIAVGGIHSEQDAIEKLEAGADLIQLYTGFIYEGPSLIKRINKAIIEYNKSKHK
ncbi:MAG: quinone-dependent dihydroorotate dehydrogenase [Bacteroidota bacterium]